MSIMSFWNKGCDLAARDDDLLFRFETRTCLYFGH